MEGNKCRNAEKSHRVVVLCSGIGSSIIGYEQAQLDVVLAIDNDGTSSQVLSQNFKNLNLFWQSIENTKGEDVRYICKNELDILDIAIPSHYINSEVKESLLSQSKFLMDVLRLIWEAQPKIAVFHFDNRFNRGKHRLLVNEWIELMKQIGYDIHLEALKGSLYGVPNEKKWAFIIGVRKDIGIKPVFPEAIDLNVSTKYAIEHLLTENPDVKVNPNRLELVKNHFYSGITLKEAKNIAIELDLPIQPALYRRDRWEEPFYPIHGTNTRPFHPLLDRLLSVNEAKKLQTFPEGYILTNNPSFNWKEIWSSVPPILIKHIAKTLKKDILNHL